MTPTNQPLARGYTKGLNGMGRISGKIVKTFFVVATPYYYIRHRGQSMTAGELAKKPAAYLLFLRSGSLMFQTYFFSIKEA